MAKLVPLYRLFNGKDHFYTCNKKEAESAASTDYHFEGKDGMALILDAQETGTVPLFRLYDAQNGDHFYTSNEAERVSAINGGYVYEGITGYLYTSAQGAASPLYRCYNSDSGDHFYTVDKAEAKNSGYTLEDSPGFVLFPDVQLDVQFDTIKYHPRTSAPPKPVLVYSAVVHNQSSVATVHPTVILGKEMQSSFAWGFSESLNFGHSVTASETASIGIPTVGEASVSLAATVQWNVTLSSHQDFSKTETTAINQEVTIDVPPKGYVRAQGTMNWVNDATVPFTMTLRILGHNKTGELSGSQVASFVLSQNPKMTVQEAKNTWAIMKVEGVFSGTYGVVSDISVTDVPPTKDVQLVS